MFALAVHAVGCRFDGGREVIFSCGCGMTVDREDRPRFWIFCPRHSHWRFIFMLPGQLPGHEESRLTSLN